MAKLRLIYIGLSLDDTGVSQQMAFISGQSLHPFSQHIFKMLQDLAAAEIQLVTHTHTQTRCTCTCTHIRQILFYCSSSTEHTDYTAVQSCVP